MRSDEVGRRSPADLMSSTWNSSETDPVHGEAAAWFERLARPTGTISQAEVSEFEAWRDEDPQHAAAFVRIVETSYMVSATSADREWDRQKLADDRYEGNESIGSWNRTPRRSRVIYAMAASLALAIVIGAAWLQIAGRTSEQRALVEDVYRTAVGENKTVVLADGSQLTLGGRTQVGVVLTEQKRTVKLVEGEAYFSVRKDAKRRFVVYAGSVTVTAVGTAFNVNQANDTSVVTVTEGQVLVARAAPLSIGASVPKVSVKAGEQSTANNSGIGEPVDVVDLASILSWQSGLLSFRQRPLREAVQDVNRYSTRQLVIATSSIGDIAVTGTVDPGNVRGWIRSLERAFDLKAIEESGQIALYSASAVPTRGSP